MTALRGAGALTRAYLLESWRSKPALFWNLAFPLLVLVVLSYIFGGGEASRVLHILPGILTITLLAGAFFGISLHMVSLRESGLYRRYRVTPITSLAVIVAHTLTGAANVAASMALQIIVARLLFHVGIQGSIPALVWAIGLSAFALIPLGIIVGSLARDMRSAPAISNLLFFPMMFLSGAAMPLFLMPDWLKRLAQFMPATYVVELLQGVIIRGEDLQALWLPAVVLLGTGIVGFVADAMLFRWEGSQPLSKRGLLSAVIGLAGLYAVVFASGPVLKSAAKPEVARARYSASALVLRGMTVFDGLGRRIENARVVIDGDRITEVVTDAGGPVAGGATERDLSGLYMIPGLIESHAHIGGSAGGSASLGEYLPPRVIHDLQVYLALGVTSFVSMTDDYDDLVGLRRAVAAGTMRAPRPFFSGPGITAPSGHPVQLFKSVPGLAERLTRQVNTPEEAQQAVRELATKRVDVVKFFLDQGWSGDRHAVLSDGALRAGVAMAKSLGLRTTAHVDNDRHARLAIDAGIDGIEHVPPDLSDATIALMVQRGITLTPTLAAYEGLARAVQGQAVTDPLALEWVDGNVIASLASSESWIADTRRSAVAVRYFSERYTKGLQALCRAVGKGVRIVAGSDAGNPGTFHGPGLLRELELLVESCGMRDADAIRTATGNAAERLGNREIGRIAPDAFADLVVLGTDPTQDIRALRDVRMVYLGGKEIDRNNLFSTNPGDWLPGQPE